MNRIAGGFASPAVFIVCGAALCYNGERIRAGATDGCLCRRDDTGIW